MTKSKKWIISGSVLVGVGMLICLTAYALSGYDFTKLNNVKYVSNTYNVNDVFENINIKADTENISFLPSDDGKCKVVCYEEENMTHNVRTENGTLVIDGNTKKKVQIMNIGVMTQIPEITLYLPKKEYEILTIDSDTGDTVIPKEISFESINVTLSTGDVTCNSSADGTISIGTDTGDINIYNVSASDMKLVSDTGDVDISDVTLTENLYIEENTGDVTMKNVSCRNFTSKEDTGSLNMTNVIASDEFRLESDTGDIEFNGCDAETIYAKSDTGDITGTLLRDKLFITETDTGNVNVPKTVTGGRCEIITDTGDINIEVK